MCTFNVIVNVKLLFRRPTDSSRFGLENKPAKRPETVPLLRRNRQQETGEVQAPSVRTDDEL
jgi:hypothetical protein